MIIQVMNLLFRNVPYSVLLLMSIITIILCVHVLHDKPYVLSAD